MNVLLISPNATSKRNNDWFPIGLSYIASYLKQNNHKIVALNMNNFDREEGYNILKSTLENNEIDVIGLGGIITFYNEFESLIKFIRPLSKNKPIVLGGGITSCESELIMSTLKPDFMVIGEGELIFQELLNTIQGNKSYHEVKGIWFWDNEKPLFTGSGNTPASLDSLPFPSLEDFDYLEKCSNYQEPQSEVIEYSFHLLRFDKSSKEKWIPISASRSCPFRCTFCYHAGMGDYKKHSINYVIDLIEKYVQEFNIHQFTIFDELFSANENRIIEFCDELKRRNLNIKWFCQLRVDQLSQKLLDRIKDAGCSYISFGFESGSDLILDKMKKKINSSQISTAVKMCRKAKIGIQANFLFGDPNETKETLQESLSFQDENQLYFVDWSAVIPYPGTQLFQHCLDKGLIKDKVDFIRSICDTSYYLYKKKVNMTSSSNNWYNETYLELRELNDINHRKHRTKLSGKAIGKFRSKVNIQCPHCRNSKHLQLTYPPECNQFSEPNPKSLIGVHGINVLCPSCYQKHHISAKDIPHIKLIYSKFQERIDFISQSKQPCVILPALDRFKNIFFEDINLNDLEVEAVLDWRTKQIGTQFLNHEVEQLNSEAISKYKQCIFIILPWVEHEDAYLLLKSQNVSDENILCWHHYFLESKPQLITYIESTI